MKSTLFAFLFLASLDQLTAQTNKMFVSLEYSPNFTNTTSPYSFDQESGYRFANNIFAKAGYSITNNLYVNAGIGYLTAKDYSSIDINDGNFQKIQQVRIHGYVVAPVGFTYYMGSFFVSPEIGIGWNTTNKMKDVIYYSDGSVVENTWVDEHNFYNVNETTYPLFLSLGNEIKFKSWSILLGVKGYYSLNSVGERATNAGHYFGFGIITGVKF